MRVFVFVFLLFPLLELAVMIKVGSAIGVLPTLLLIVAGVVIGLLLLRLTGMTTALRARESLARGEAPEQDMLAGLLMAVGAGLILLPGFISDAVGLLCLLPLTRNFFIARLKRRAEAQAARQRAFFDDIQARSGQVRPDVIEGEYQRRD